MRAADLCIDDLLQMDPQGGVITFGGNRTLLFDAVALGLLRAQLVETLGLNGARGLLTRLGYSHGWRTAESMEHAVDWTEAREWRIAGGRLHRLQGLVTFEPVARTRADAVAEAIWHDAYEAEQHVLHLGRADGPVCWSLCGFASGYLSRVTGEAVYAVEERCCGMGDAACHMVARTEAAWGDAIDAHKRFYERGCLDASLVALRDAVKKAEARLHRHQTALGADADAVHDGLVARSPAMRRVLDLARRVAPVDSTVLIQGESGVGKERVARFVHGASRRATGPFVAVNCSALPAELLESELFGHVRGAFTGATHDRVGLFEAARNGTLLLDEIGDMPLPLQTRLLRVLQEREVRRVGENRPRPVDVRVLAASHRDLMGAVQAGAFREDLYYRLRVVQIDIPPLRARVDDILPLARMMLADVAGRYDRPIVDFTAEAARALVQSAWPGNVRELHNVIEQAVVLARGARVTVDDLRLAPHPAPAASVAARPAAVDQTLADVERAHIMAVLAASDGNRAEAARRLGIGVATLFRRLKAYGVTGARR